MTGHAIVVFVPHGLVFQFERTDIALVVARGPLIFFTVRIVAIRAHKIIWWLVAVRVGGRGGRWFA